MYIQTTSGLVKLITVIVYGNLEFTLLAIFIQFYNSL